MSAADNARVRLVVSELDRKDGVKVVKSNYIKTAGDYNISNLLDVAAPYGIDQFVSLFDLNKSSLKEAGKITNVAVAVRSGDVTYYTASSADWSTFADKFADPTNPITIKKGNSYTVEVSFTSDKGGAEDVDDRQEVFLEFVQPTKAFKNKGSYKPLEGMYVKAGTTLAKLIEDEVELPGYDKVNEPDDDGNYWTLVYEIASDAKLTKDTQIKTKWVKQADWDKIPARFAAKTTTGNVPNTATR